MVGLLDAVHWTGRASALLFSVALALPVVLRRPGSAAGLYALFIAAHTLHFATVVAYALMVPGAALFPQGRTLQSAGGWSSVAAIFALFYTTALLGYRARRAFKSASNLLAWVGDISTVFIAFMFLKTYLPLLERSAWYAAPAAAVVAGLVVWLLPRVRRLRPWCWQLQ